MNGRDRHNPPLVQSLTRREQEILHCIGDGMTNRQIAEHLTVALSTVKWYVRQIYNKLGIYNREEAIAYTGSLGLPERKWKGNHPPAREQKKGVRHNLPAAATPFVGREQELAALAGLIADPEVRIITLFGPGGIGKTRLALEVARRELAPSINDDQQQEVPFSDGIFFVSLSPRESADEIITTLAATFDFHFQGSGNETKQILDYLKQKKMLLVLDNFEYILDGQTFLAKIREQALGIMLLVTSRERLHLRGEQLFPIKGLEMPPSEDFAGEMLTDYAAVLLFLNIARRTVPDFQLLAGDAIDLHHICQLVEGMPLGLELAASWVGMLPLSAIAAEIERSLQLLTTDHQDVAQRHRSMQATLDVSWGRLSSEQKRGFQELTVFRSGFTRMAALEVAKVTLPLLVTLVNKSWLSYDWESDRYAIHELLRQYGTGKLGADLAHEQAARDRHSAFFCSYLQEREADWYGSGQRKAALEVRDEFDNIKSAWRWAANKGDGVLLAQGLNSLCRFYLWEGWMTDGCRACRSAGKGLSQWLAEQQADNPQLLALWSQILAWESVFVNELEQKEKLLAQSLEILDSITPTGWDKRAEQAFILLVKAYAAGNKDYEEAIRFSNLGLELFRELGNRWGEAEALGTLGGNYSIRGEFDRANDLLRESLIIRRQLEDMQGIAETMMRLGLVAQRQGNFEEAETLHQQSARLFNQLGTRFREAYSLVVLSFTLSWAGNFNDAREASAKASELARDLGQKSSAWSFVAITIATIHLGRTNEAKAIATQALETARKRGHLTEIGFSLMYLGNVALVEGDCVEAKRYLLESASILGELRHVNQALPLAVLSYAARAQGDGQLACDYLESALRAGIESRSIRTIMFCLPAAALIAADNGQPDRAIALYSQAQQFGHITNSRWFEAIACQELVTVIASAAPEIATAAEARGQELDVWTTAEQLLSELSEP